MEGIRYVLGSAQDREDIAALLRDLSSVAEALTSSWALIGGHALIAHGVPRDTSEIDILVAADQLGQTAAMLMERFGWEPQRYDLERRGFVSAGEVTVHTTEGQLPASVGFSRNMIPLRRRPKTICVKLHAAHSPVEQEAISCPETVDHYFVPVPVAPLGAVLLMKGAANRVVDLAAIEQTADHLRSAVLREAID